MLHTSDHFRRIHRWFIAPRYRRGCLAAGSFPLHSESYPTAAGFALETVELVTRSSWC